MKKTFIFLIALISSGRPWTKSRGDYLAGLELYVGVKNLFGFFPREEVILRAFDPFDKQNE